MWVPRDAQEIEEAVKAGFLEETASLDAKESLPTKKKNIDLAIDVAAMSTDGGLLLYGVGEDEQHRLTHLKPIELAGASDRISQIITTSIAEVPYVDIQAHPLNDNPTRGYITVLVPQSARAPHQVIVGDDKRYYGRNAKGNRRLAEGDVARLYERRLEWEQDKDSLLDRAIQLARFPAHPELAYLHAFTRPVALDRQLWKRAVEAAGGLMELQVDLRHAADRAEVQNPSSSRLAPNWRQQGADAWLFSTLPDVEAANEPDQADQAADIRIEVDGRGFLFFGRAGAMANGGSIVVLEPAIAGAFASFIAIMGRLYDLGAYRGAIDLGLGLTNLEGSISSTSRSILNITPYRADSYRRLERAPASELLDPKARAREMLMDFLAATTGQDNYDPFSD